MSSVCPFAKEWKDFITSAGGTLLNRRPKTFDEHTIIIVTDAKFEEKDRTAFIFYGYKIYDAVDLLSGLMTHKFQTKRAINTLQDQYAKQETLRKTNETDLENLK
jgi:hypothetical protein